MDPTSSLPTPANYATPQQLQQMYEYANALRGNVTSGKLPMPVHNPLGIINALVQGGVAGAMFARAGDQQRQQRSAQADYIDAMSNYGAGMGAGAGAGYGAGAATSPAGPYSANDQSAKTAANNQNLQMDESGNNPLAQNPRSSASGDFQFTRDTWNDTAARHPELKLGSFDSGAWQDDTQQKLAKGAFDQDNSAALTAMGLEPSQTNLNLAHRFGATGASRVINAPPGTPMASVVPQSVMSANPDLANKTVDDLKQKYAQIAGNVPMSDTAATVQALARGTPQQSQFVNPYAPMYHAIAEGIRNGTIDPQVGMIQAMQLRQAMVPQYSVDQYGRLRMDIAGNYPRILGQFGPGQSGTFMGMPTMSTVTPSGGVNMQILTPGQNAPPWQGGQAAPTQQRGDIPAPTGTAQAAPAPTGTAQAAPAPTGTAQAAPAPTAPVQTAGPLPQGTQVPQPPPVAALPATNPNAVPQMPPAGSDVRAWQQYQQDVKAAQEGATESAKATGTEAAKARAAPVAAAIAEGTGAPSIINDLDTIADAYKNAGPNGVNGGPFKARIVQAQQLANEFLPDTFKMENLQPAEIIQKVNQNLATKMVKELTSRGTQMEIMMAMKNNPGIMMSDKGSMYMVNLLRQIQVQKQQQGELAQDYLDNPRGWNTAQRDFYDKHPLMSPFHPEQRLDGKIVADDMNEINLPSASSPTSGAPGVLPPFAPMRTYNAQTGKLE
jgi:hypothetical protein